MFRLRSNVLLLLLLAVALQQVALSEEEESSSSSVDTLELEIQLAALKESYRDESLPPVRSWHVAQSSLRKHIISSSSFFHPYSLNIIFRTGQCHWSIGRLRRTSPRSRTWTRHYRRRGRGMAGGWGRHGHILQ